MDNRDILKIKDSSISIIARSLQIYYDMLKTSAELKKIDIKKAFFYRPGKETYQTCISILDGIIAARLSSKISSSHGQLIRSGAVYDFDKALVKNSDQTYKNILFPDLDLDSKVDGELSVDGYNALKWHYSNLHKLSLSAAKFLTTGMHIAYAIKRDVVIIPGDQLDRKLIREGSFCGLGDDINNALMWAIMDNKGNDIKTD